ncbi:transcription factor IIA, alpha/beta subunit [Podospora didyma]|uniref:Transcription initiation factor IIA large subunit n=1 Tax=Podospora didyma TaxID=330526 RepID=A0AAE0U7L2_9PEZI|nr:transcription factor IIA, alpha/beta subunit [Podospora didyma]
MSNANVGNVYDHIIQEVINAVRVDFEENGVDDGVLEELKKGWQHKLSQMNVASFPWDPKPEPPPPAPPAHTPAPATLPSQHQQQPQQQQQHQQAASYTQATLSPQTSAQPLSLPGNLHSNGNGIAIKSEPGLQKLEPVIKQEPGVGMQGQAGIPPPYNPGNGARQIAAQRAAQALESNYGPRAAASISAIQNNIQQAPRQGQQPLQQQQQQQQQQQHMQQQYRQGVINGMQQRMQQHGVPQGVPQNPPNGLPAAQVDGPSDAYDGVLMKRGVEMGRVEIDNLIHAQIASRAKQMEGGGLMLPLKEATKTRSIAKAKPVDGATQFDGPDDSMKDEDLDDDAINSDLDDSDDNNDDDEEDDEGSGQMMLCMYDKVQRVKNKWKCTLKDGVLTVNGREYVFHKATGEYEW